MVDTLQRTAGFACYAVYYVVRARECVHRLYTPVSARTSHTLEVLYRQAMLALGAASQGEIPNMRCFLLRKGIPYWEEGGPNSLRKS